MFRGDRILALPSRAGSTTADAAMPGSDAVTASTQTPSAGHCFLMANTPGFEVDVEDQRHRASLTLPQPFRRPGHFHVGRIVAALDRQHNHRIGDAGRDRRLRRVGCEPKPAARSYGSGRQQTGGAHCQRFTGEKLQDAASSICCVECPGIPGSTRRTPRSAKR